MRADTYTRCSCLHINYTAGFVLYLEGCSCWCSNVRFTLQTHFKWCGSFTWESMLTRFLRKRERRKMASGTNSFFNLFPFEAQLSWWIHSHFLGDLQSPSKLLAGFSGNSPRLTLAWLSIFDRSKFAFYGVAVDDLPFLCMYFWESSTETRCSVP